MPLILAGTGSENIIRKVGGSPELKKHLENLGFVPGTEVTVMNSIGGNLIVSIKGARIALSREMASRIIV